MSPATATTRNDNVRDRRTINRLSDAQSRYNRLQAGRALVEQSIAHLANAWALRR